MPLHPQAQAVVDFIGMSGAIDAARDGMELIAGHLRETFAQAHDAGEDSRPTS